MSSFLLKFFQDNFFSAYFYTSSDLAHDFFRSVIVNLLFIFYFLFGLYFLNFISYVRHNLFTDPVVSRLIRLLVVAVPEKEKAEHLSKEALFYLFNFLTLLEVLIKSSFLLAVSFLSLKFPFVELGNSFSLSWKFSDLFSKSRFYSRRPVFSANPTDRFNSTHVATSEFHQKFSSVKTIRNVKKQGTLYTQRFRPEPPPPPEMKDRDKWGFGLMITKRRERYKINKEFPELLFKLGYRCTYALYGKKLYLTPQAKGTFPISYERVEKAWDRQWNRGTSFVKALDRKRDQTILEPSTNFSYFRPESEQRSAPLKGGFLTRIFFPGGRSKWIVFKSLYTPVTVRDKELEAFAPLQDDFDPSLWPEALSDIDIAPSLDDHWAFKRFGRYLEKNPKAEPSLENFKIVERLRVLRDIKDSYRKRMEAHNRFAKEYPNLADPYIESQMRVLYTSLNEFLEKTAPPKRFVEEEIDEEGYLSRDEFRFRKNFRIQGPEKHMKQDIDELDDIFDVPFDWPAEYLNDSKVPTYDEKEDPEDTLTYDTFSTPIDSRNFERDFRSRSLMAQRGLLDILTTRLIRFLRRFSSFDNKEFKGYTTLPRHNPNSSNLRRFVPYNSYDRRDYALFSLNVMNQPDRLTYIDQLRVMNDFAPVSARTGGISDSKQHPYIGPVDKIRNMEDDLEDLTIGHDERVYINGQNFAARVLSDDSEIPIYRYPAGFLLQFFRSMAQFAIDQTIYLVANLLSYFNMLNKVWQFVPPSAASTVQAKPRLNYYTIKLRILYFFRKVSRWLLLNSGAGKSNYNYRAYGVDYSSEIDNFTLATIKSSFGAVASRVLVITALVLLNSLNNLLLSAVEFIVLHPAVAVALIIIILLSVWRIVYPFEEEFRYLINIQRFGIFATALEQLDRLKALYRRIDSRAEFAEEALTEGLFPRGLSEEPYDYQFRFYRAIEDFFTFVGYYESKLNRIINRSGKDRAYDRTMFKAYARIVGRSIRRRSVRRFIKAWMPLITRIFYRLNKPRAALLAARRLKQFIRRDIPRAIRVGYTNFKVHYKNSRSSVRARYSKYSYSFKDWLNS